eukprot:TRINITY_DN512_c0_g1_i2.p1 TRINITY_DN512_c0_g1~~TRINITY_DN512_c0_g1_i2.p1  ORF type:complete len:336 (+),score=123.54 TRINITY_DN512_c0_g1_i2:83-1090(+)
MRVSSVITTLLLLVCAAYAQTEQEATENAFSTSQVPSTLPPGISTAYVFPDHPDRKIISGEIVEVLLGFVNHGYSSMNISHLSAGLSHPLDRTYFLQNYSKAEYGLTVNPNEQISVSYRFRPDAMLDPRDYGLVVIVYYHDDVGRQHVTPFFNGTITIVEPHSVFDFQQFSLYVIMIAMLGGAGYYYTQVYSPSGVKKTNKTRFTPSSSSSDDAGTSKRQVSEDDEWLQGTNILRAKSPQQIRKKQQVNTEIKSTVQSIKETQAKKEKVDIVHKAVNKEIKEVAKTKEAHKAVSSEIKTKGAQKEVAKEIKEVAKAKVAHKEVNQEIKGKVSKKK